MAHNSGKIRPPTAQCGSTKASCRLGTPMVIVSVLASVRAAPAVAGAADPGVVVDPLAAAVPAEPAVVEVDAAVVPGAAAEPGAPVVELDLESLDQAARNAAIAIAP